MPCTPAATIPGPKPGPISRLLKALYPWAHQPGRMMMVQYATITGEFLHTVEKKKN